MKIQRLAALVVAVSTVAPVVAHLEGTTQVVIENDRLEPRTLETLTGQRINFVNRTGYPVHLQLSRDIRQHEVIQIPATGPVLAIFHIPGTHPYVVHITDGRLARWTASSA